jgi:hypothetical protein
LDLHHRRVYRDHEGADDNGRQSDCPTNKSFQVDFCTVAHWNENGEIMEENLFYDLMGMLKQIGVM